MAAVDCVRLDVASSSQWIPQLLAAILCCASIASHVGSELSQSATTTATTFDGRLSAFDLEASSPANRHHQRQREFHPFSNNVHDHQNGGSPFHAARSSPHSQSPFNAVPVSVPFATVASGAAANRTPQVKVSPVTVAPVPLTIQLRAGMGKKKVWPNRIVMSDSLWSFSAIVPCSESKQFHRCDGGRRIRAE